MIAKKKHHHTSVFHIFDVCIHQNACFQFYPAFCNVSYMYFTYKLSIIYLEVSKPLQCSLVLLFRTDQHGGVSFFNGLKPLSKTFSSIPLKHTPQTYPQTPNHQQFMVSGYGIPGLCTGVSWPGVVRILRLLRFGSDQISFVSFILFLVRSTGLGGRR